MALVSLAARAALALSVASAFLSGRVGVGLGASAVTVAASPEAVIELSGNPTRVPLEVIGQFDQATASAKRIFLVVTGLAASLPPGAAYDIFLDLPDHAAVSRDDPGYVGTLNFFSLPMGSASEEERSVAFDAAPAISRLAKARRAVLGRTVTLVPNAPPFPSAKPSLRQIKIIVE